MTTCRGLHPRCFEQTLSKLRVDAIWPITSLSPVVPIERERLPRTAKKILPFLASLAVLGVLAVFERHREAEWLKHQPEAESRRQKLIVQSLRAAG